MELDISCDVVVISQLGILRIIEVCIKGLLDGLNQFILCETFDFVLRDELLECFEVFFVGTAEESADKDCVPGQFALFVSVGQGHELISLNLEEL